MSATALPSSNFAVGFNAFSSAKRSELKRASTGSGRAICILPALSCRTRAIGSVVLDGAHQLASLSMPPVRRVEGCQEGEVLGMRRRCLFDVYVYLRVCVCVCVCVF